MTAYGDFLMSAVTPALFERRRRLWPDLESLDPTDPLYPASQ